MSLGQRLTGNKNEKGFDAQKYEALIGRLKVLSKSQTALLKSYLHGKLMASVSLVNKAIDHLGRQGENDARARELKSALSALKLEEIDVDVTSTKVMLYEELAQLRGAVDFYEITNISGTKSSPAGDSVQIQALEAENARLKALLKDAQNAPPPIPAASNGSSGTSSEEVNRLRSDLANKGSEIDSLNERIRQLNRELTENQSAVKNNQDNAAKSDRGLRDELDASQRRESNMKWEIEELNRKYGVLRAELEESTRKERQLRGELDDANKGDKSLKIELDVMTQRERASSERADEAKKAALKLETQLSQAKSDSAAALAVKTKELNEAWDAKLKDSERRLEAEKDEMMEAMAQEVEEIEKTKNAEIEAVTAEREKWHNKFTALQRVNYALIFGFRRLSENAKALVRENATMKQETKRDLEYMAGQLKAMSTTMLIKKLKDLQEEVQVATQKYRREMAERKRLHNMVQELKGNIRVYMRCRPPTAKELEQFGNDACCVTFPGPGEVKVFNEKNREKAWEFDEVFDTNSKQSDVYEDVSALVTSVMDGFNVCIFAYGQTGSGKTWTMSGPADNRGVNTRALTELFQKARDRSEEWNDTITVSLLEVYNEAIRDLLSDGKSDDKLEVKMGEFGNHVPGLTSVPVDSIQAVLQLLVQADRNRASATTNMNEHSSRSHMMLSVTVVSEFKPTGAVTRGKLNLVDLAGSERIDKSGAVGQALKEAQNINKSLSALGDVIAARAQKTAHVPFRNSTLTFLLQDSLSQDSKTLMIVCVSPVLYNAEETFCSLNFAARVRTVELGKASKNTITSSAGATAGTASSSAKSQRETPPLTRRTSMSSASPTPR